MPEGVLQDVQEPAVEVPEPERRLLEHPAKGIVDPPVPLCYPCPSTPLSTPHHPTARVFPHCPRPTTPLPASFHPTTRTFPPH